MWTNFNRRAGDNGESAPPENFSESRPTGSPRTLAKRPITSFVCVDYVSSPEDVSMADADCMNNFAEAEKGNG